MLGMLSVGTELDEILSSDSLFPFLRLLVEGVVFRDPQIWSLS